MFDHLDDPSFTGPGPESRARVNKRATAIRRKRWVLATSAAACLALAAVTVAAGTTGPDAVRTIEPLTSESASASAIPDVSEAPSPTPSPSPRRLIRRRHQRTPRSSRRVLSASQRLRRRRGLS